MGNESGEAGGQTDQDEAQLVALHQQSGIEQGVSGGHAGGVRTLYTWNERPTETARKVSPPRL